MKKVLSLLTFVVVMLLSCNVFAQSDYQDVVYLKNGSVIRGIIIEQVPNVSIKIQTADRNIFVYNISEVEKITKELLPTKPKFVGMKTDCYRGSIEAGYAIGMTKDYGVDRLVINTSHGYQLDHHSYFGVGIGLHHYFHSKGYYLDSHSNVFPIFADFKGTFLQSRVSPFINIRIGYSFSEGKHNEGFYFSPSAGINLSFSDIALNLYVGYEMQKFDTRYYDAYYDKYRKNKENFGAISFRFGIEF